MIRRPVVLASLGTVVVLATMLLAACGTNSPAAPPASPSASPKASTSAPSSASPSASASTKADPAAEQAYQKAQQDWNKVVEAARQEGEATIYVVGQPDSNAMLQNGFNKVDPKIQVKLVSVIAAQATERIRGENATKQYVGNVYTGGTVRPMAQEGLGRPADLLAMHDPSIPWIIRPEDPPLDTVAYSFNKYHVLVNTNLAPAGQEPKTWSDLGDPKWKGKLTLWDPKISGTGQTLLTFLYQSPAHGPELVKRIIDNLVVTTGPNEGAQLVAKGELALSLSSYGAYNIVKDGPVKLTNPTDGAVGNVLFGLLLKNAPQPNTGRLHLDWLLGKEGQRIQGMGFSVIRSDVEGEAKSAQVVGETFFRGVPVTVDDELKKEPEIRAKIAQMTKDAGK